MTFASPVPASASGSSPTPAAAKPVAKAGTHGAGKARVIHATRTATPPVLTPAQKRQQELAGRQRLGNLPFSTPSGTGGSKVVKSAPTVGAAKKATKSGPKAPGDFNYFRATDMTQYTNSGDSSINEPSVSNMGYDVLYTGNWYAALSTDSGNSFTFINPYNMLPGFCCDQVTISDYSRGQTFWLLQGGRDGNGNNVDRILWANQNNEAINNWFSVDFSAQTFGFPSGD
jgi:hypothetical protein